MKRHEIDNLDKLLSERLKSVVEGGGAANWLDVRRRAGENEAPARWPRRRLLLAAVVIVLGVGACAGSKGVIPWLNQKPAKSKYHPPKLASACSAKDLKARLFLQGATGSLAGAINIENIGRRPCSLIGQPKISLIGAAARATKWRVERISSSKFFPSEGMLRPPDASLRALQPGRSARVGLWWSNWCGPGSVSTGGGSGTPPAAIELRLQGGSTIVVPLRDMVPRCDVQGMSTLGATRLVPASTPPPANSRLPLRATIVDKRTTIVGKRTVYKFGSRFLLHRGEVFRYRVALKNTSKHPFRFGSCPSYYEELALTKPRLTYTLNCRSVGTIAPGETVLFAMEYRVPENTRLGNGGLWWELAPQTNNPPYSDAAVLVVP